MGKFLNYRLKGGRLKSLKVYASSHIYNIFKLLSSNIKLAIDTDFAFYLGVHLDNKSILHKNASWIRIPISGLYINRFRINFRIIRQWEV